jgi:hypothetical protein
VDPFLEAAPFQEVDPYQVAEVPYLVVDPFQEEEEVVEP